MNNNYTISTKAWLVRPNPDEKPRLEEFLSKGIVAVGWPGIGDLTGKSREQLKQLLSQPPYSYSSLKLGNAYATVDIFVNQMREGDLVLVPNGDDIYLGQLAGGYYHEPSVDNPVDGYPHQRPVTWFPVSVSRQELSKELRSSLKVHRTVANLSAHTAEIDALSHGRAYEPEGAGDIGTTTVSYPLRPGHMITFSIPNDITRQEAQRLSAYFASLYFTE